MLGQLLVAACATLAGWGAVQLPGASAFWFFPAAGGAALTTLAFDLFLRALVVRRPEAWARWLGPPLRFFAWLSRPVRVVLVSGIERLARPFGGGKPTLAPALTSLEDVEAYLAAEAGTGKLGTTDPELLRSVLEFSEKTAREVMVPRTAVVGIEVSTPPEEVVQLLSERGHSRLPVYRETMDDILGILHTRDLVPLLANPKLIVIQDIMRPATFVPWAKRIGALLREMQQKRSHLAVVVDEYGGVMGIATLEDILEEIVGEIRDDRQPEGRDVEILPDGAALVRAGISLDDFSKAFGVQLPAGEYETLAGWMNSQCGSIPEQGDRFFADNLQFTVVDRSPRRVRRVRVLRAQKGRSPSWPGVNARGDGRAAVAVPAAPAGAASAAVAPSTPKRA
jgi:CBS domain containing-hemolysin-like protein